MIRSLDKVRLVGEAAIFGKQPRTALPYGSIGRVLIVQDGQALVLFKCIWCFRETDIYSMVDIDSIEIITEESYDERYGTRPSEPIRRKPTS